MALVAGSLFMELNRTHDVTSHFFRSALLHFTSFDRPMCGMTDQTSIHGTCINFFNVIFPRPAMCSTHPKQHIQEAGLLAVNWPKRDFM
jgi:hypothetical protein